MVENCIYCNTSLPYKDDDRSIFRWHLSGHDLKASDHQASKMSRIMGVLDVWAGTREMRQDQRSQIYSMIEAIIEE